MGNNLSSGVGVIRIPAKVRGCDIGLSNPSLPPEEYYYFHMLEASLRVHCPFVLHILS